MRFLDMPRFIYTILYFLIRATVMFAALFFCIYVMNSAKENWDYIVLVLPFLAIRIVDWLFRHIVPATCINETCNGHCYASVRPNKWDVHFLCSKCGHVSDSGIRIGKKSHNKSFKRSR